MPLYFLIHDATRFTEHIAPALRRCWMERSFRAAGDFWQELQIDFARYAQRYRLSEAPALFVRAMDGLAFQPDRWRLIVGEALLFAAVAIPDIDASPTTLLTALAPPGERSREDFVPVEQAVLGKRDIHLGGFYRPETAGWNDRNDTQWLADWWKHLTLNDAMGERLAVLPELADENDRRDEWNYLCDTVIPSLRGLYTDTARVGQMIVIEKL